MKFEWEKLKKDVRRAKVFGGWIVHCYTENDISDGDGNACALSESLVFIEDINHEWEIEQS